MTASGSQLRLRYDFAPLPQRVRPAIREGTLSESKAIVLVELYGRADRKALSARRPCVRITLDDLAESIGWDRSDDWLSKLLRELKAEGWLSYPKPVRRSDGRYVYVITLHPEGSELTPNRAAEAAPAWREDETRAHSAVSHPDTGPGSELADAEGQAESPGKGFVTPSCRATSNPDGESDFAVESLRRLRAVQNFRGSPTPASEGGPPGVPPLKDRGDLPLSEIMGRTKEAAQHLSPGLGDPGFLDFLHDRYRAGLLTRLEWLGSAELHGVLWRARPAGEEAVLGSIEELVGEGVLVRLDGEETGR